MQRPYTIKNFIDYQSVQPFPHNVNSMEMKDDAYLKLVEIRKEINPQFLSQLHRNATMTDAIIFCIWDTINRDEADAS